MPAPTMTFGLDRPPTEEEGFSVRRSESLTVELSPTDAVTPDGMKTAVKDAELMMELFRDHPDDLRSFYNDVVAGRTDNARETAIRIGLTESSFKQQGGGMWPFIIGVGIVIMGCAMTDLCDHS